MHLLSQSSPAADAGPSPVARTIPRAFFQAEVGLLKPGASPTPLPGPNAPPTSKRRAKPQSRETRETQQARGARSSQAAPPAPRSSPSYTCHIHQPALFDEGECTACHTPLGYAPAAGLLLPPKDTQAGEFLQLMDRWTALTAALDELSRSKGLGDPYPAALSPVVVRKLHFVHRIVAAAAAQEERT